MCCRLEGVAAALLWGEVHTRMFAAPAAAAAPRHTPFQFALLNAFAASATVPCRCNKMSEVWVPTEFNRRTFAASGVHPAKLQVGVLRMLYQPQSQQPAEKCTSPGAPMVASCASVRELQVAPLPHPRLSPPPAMQVVPEPVDTAFFDPTKHKPLPLPLGLRVFGPAWPHSQAAGSGAAAAAGGGAAGAAGAADGKPSLSSGAAVQAGASKGGGGAEPFVFLSVFKWEERKVRETLSSASHKAAFVRLPLRARLARAVAHCLFPKAWARHEADCAPHLPHCRPGLGRAAACLPVRLHRRRQRAAAAAHQALPQPARLPAADAGGAGAGGRLVLLLLCTARNLRCPFAYCASGCQQPSGMVHRAPPTAACPCTLQPALLISLKYPPVLQAWAKKELGEALAGDTSRLPSVYVLSEHIPQSHFPRLFKSADCFVLPTR